MSGPSILFINRVLPPHRGATGHRLAELAARLAAAGWRVSVLACGDAGEIPGVTVVRAGGREPKGAVGYALDWLRLAARALGLPRHDVVVTMTDPSLLALLGPVLARLKGSRAVHWSHDLYPDLLPVIGRPLPVPLHRLLGRLMALALRRHEAVVAIGRCMARLIAAAGVEPGRVLVVPNWADAGIRPDPDSARRLRRDLGIDGCFVVGYAGNFGLAHPLTAVLDAARRLAREGAPVHFLLSGEGRGRSAVEALLAAGRPPNVTLLPWQPAETLPALLSAADLHLAVMAEAAEGLLVPNKVAGALAAGRPCLLLGPRGSEAAAAVLAAGGSVLAPGDAAGLAEAIRRRLGGPEVTVRPGVTAEEAARRFLAIVGELAPCR